MALATRPKPNAHYKKSQAHHHRHSKDYLKTYWPYLPMLIIVGTGAIVNKTLYSSGLGSFAATEPQASTRVQALTNNASWSLMAIIAVTVIAAIVFTFMNWYRFRRMLTRGEDFAVHHPWFDISLVFVLTAGVILTRSIA